VQIAQTDPRGKYNWKIWMFLL